MEITMANVLDDDVETLDFADESEYAYDSCLVCEGEGCDACDGSGEVNPAPKYRNTTRRITITKEYALEELRRYRETYPNVAPEVTAMGLMRRIDSWEEHTAILKALDEVLAESRGAE